MGEKKENRSTYTSPPYRVGNRLMIWAARSVFKREGFKESGSRAPVMTAGGESPPARRSGAGARGTRR